MNISYNWLKEYLECPLSPAEVAEALTSIGLEVDSVEKSEQVPGGLAGVVVAEVLSCEPHPDSDHLHITTVNDGGPETLTVVCGAPNVAAGQKVLFARIGAVLPGDFKIKKSKIRGVESFGMICAEDELGIGNSHEGIMVLPEDAPVGMPAKEWLHLEEDALIVVELTANRVDAASHIGVARDLYARLRHKGIPCRLKMPDVSAFREGSAEGGLAVEVRDSEGAPRYSGITLRGVRVGPSPQWLQKRLFSVGLRPINNIVDISNFVLFETGQPLHTFDAGKVRGGTVIVRRAAEGEPIVTLDGVARKLSSQDMVIADAEGPMCIAGVFGGADSGVTDGTVDVFVESAWFDPVSIRKTARRHTLQTDASFRYERGGDPDAVPYALRRAVLLIQEVAGGKVEGPVKEIYPAPVARKAIDLDYDRIERFIGKKIGHDVIRNILEGLQYRFVSEDGPRVRVEAPSYMVDVSRECDVVEEILRIYGYNNIELPSRMVMSTNPTPHPDPEEVRRSVAEFLSSVGFLETMNNSLTKGDYYTDFSAWPAECCVRIVNPLSSDLNVMRQTLLLGGLEVVAYNINRQCTHLQTFEYGSVYRRDPAGDGKTLASYEEHPCIALMMTGAPEKSWCSEPGKGSFFRLKGTVEHLCRRYGIDLYMMDTEAAPADFFSEGLVYKLPGNGRVFATLGTVSPSARSRFGIRQPVFAAEIDWNVFFELVRRGKVKYTELPKFPEVRRDLAVLLDESVSYAELRKAAFKAARKLLRSVSLFDVYRGPKILVGKKQYALSFVLQNPERTLTDVEIEKTMENILSAFRDQFGATLR